MIPRAIIEQHSAEQPNRIAVSDGDTTISWREYDDRVARVAQRLREVLRTADSPRVAAVVPNGWRTVVLASAAATLGVPFVGVDPARSAATILAQVDAVAPPVVALDTASDRHLLEGLAVDGRTLIDLADGGDPRTIPLRDLIGADATIGDSGWNPPEFLALGFTSGSTGTPKLFLRHSRTEDQRRRFLRDRLAFGEQDVYLVTSPLAHASGHVWANAALALGARIVFSEPGPDRILDTVEREGVTVAFMVPPAVEALLRRMDDTGRRPTGLRALLTGGRHLSERAVRQAGRLLPDTLHLYYATTETGIVTMAGPGDLVRRPLAAGRPMPGIEIAIVEPDDGSDVPSGRTGLIAVAGPVNMTGYASGDAGVVRRGDHDFVVTSDLGRLVDGQLEVLGRSSAGGADLVTAESAVKDLPGVDDAALVGREDLSGHHLLLAVVGEIDPAVAHAGASRALGDDRLDVRTVRLRAVPYNTAGKVDQPALFALADSHR